MRGLGTPVGLKPASIFVVFAGINKAQALKDQVDNYLKRNHSHRQADLFLLQMFFFLSSPVDANIKCLLCHQGRTKSLMKLIYIIPRIPGHWSAAFETLAKFSLTFRLIRFTTNPSHRVAGSRISNAITGMGQC